VVIVSVEFPDEVIDVGTKEDEAPAGNPVAFRLTVPVNPLSAPTFTVYVAVAPGLTDSALGVAESEKSGGTTTFSATLAEFASVPLVPVIVTVELLAELPGGVVTVSVELPGALIEGGENEAVAPVGNPAAAKLTDPVNPFCTATFTV